MKANELMIGDYIMFNKDIYKIEEISKKGWAHIIYNDESECRVALSSDYILDDITPIPLTPEILEKNGFVKYNEVSDTPPYDKDEEGNMYYSYKGEHKFWGWWQPNNVYYIPINAMIDLEIKFIHELQHALRLCGIDKELEL